MRHVEGDLQRKFHHAGKLRSLVPGRLVDQFFLSFFFDGIDVFLLRSHDLFNLVVGRRFMAVFQILSDKVAAAVITESDCSFFIHVNDRALRIADGQRTIKIFEIFHFSRIDEGQNYNFRPTIFLLA